MSLINCPECNKEISDKAYTCPNCGYPISSSNDWQEENICKINGIDIDLSTAKKYVLNNDIMNAIMCIRNLTNCGLTEAKNICDIIRKTGCVPKTLFLEEEPSLRDDQFQIEDNNTPRCPRCGSTNIQLVNRKWSLLTGFMTNKVDRVCANCKCKF